MIDKEGVGCPLGLCGVFGFGEIHWRTTECNSMCDIILVLRSSILLDGGCLIVIIVGGRYCTNLLHSFYRLHTIYAHVFFVELRENP